MNDQSSELLEKIRQQFENSPYPRTPLDQSPKDDVNGLYIHNLVTSYYLRNQKVLDTEGKVILDAGCGSGYKSLVLAEANPGAKIVGIDISEESVKLARQRLKHHGFEANTEFHVLSIYDLPQLGMEFDYINNDEVLYLVPDVAAGLRAMKSVLKPQGIIRTNLHSSIQRIGFFRAQEIFKMMGLMDKNPEEMEIEIAIETMKSLQDGVELKVRTWHPGYEAPEGKQSLLSNHLLVGDKGYTIPEMFALLRAADLEFVSMVYWRLWDVTDLFKEPDNLPAFWAMSLPEVSIEERLHLFELLHPTHRLLDFWCAHPSQVDSPVPIDKWELSDWQTAQVHLHPQLKNPKVHEDLLKCLAEQKPFEISKYITTSVIAPVLLNSSAIACLLPLWEEQHPFMSLVERWLKLQPLNLVSMEPMTEMEAFNEVKQLLGRLEVFLYVLLERST
ncbi:MULTISPECIES: methyltransferase domain-containing protein [Cyanophyceae]|nr:methyltransferase domain-containing protein [Coleofasciculus sp. FACHB-125]MBD1901278.1 methyltransferase domain-containing protein [Coleofasciculus sp. FACHB-125]